MEITPGFIYLVAVLENANVAQHLIGTLAAITLIICVFTSLESYDGRIRAKHYGYAKYSLIALLAIGLLQVFLPSGKTLAAMYILPPIVNSDAVQKLPSELTDLAIEWLRELKPNKENKE